MEIIVIAYLYLAILLYLVLGGADFGAGIIEMFTSARNVSRTRKTLYHAIGPIWEANHMWLIIAIVILFVGYPTIYSELSIYLHIPLLIMLMGIIARGTAFVFRHYDAVDDGMQVIYNRVFVWSSFITPFFLGVIAGATLSGKIDATATDFLEAYVYGWFNLFSLAVGAFTVCLCGYLAAVYLIGEADDTNDRIRFIRKARFMNIAAVAAGALVFVVAKVDDIPLAQWLFTNVADLVAIVLATFALVGMWIAINAKQRWIIRILAAFQVTMILFAVSFGHYPDIVIMHGADSLSLLRAQAPSATMAALGWALVLGSIFILPALFYLYYSFQRDAEGGA